MGSDLGGTPLFRERVLVVEDDKAIRALISTTLERQEVEPVLVSTGRAALAEAARSNPSVMLLDLGLPDMDGVEVIKAVRQWSMMFIIVVSARSEDDDKVAALDAGADDYLTKPFGTGELLARIRTALRHSQRNQHIGSSKYQVGDLLVDFERRLVKVKDQEIHLTQIEYKLVCLLAQNAGRVMTYESIITKIWGPYADNDNQILRVNMAHIRRKLEENPAEPQYIFTEIGVGYRMREE